jgi:hypothetical protein
LTSTTSFGPSGFLPPVLSLLMSSLPSMALTVTLTRLSLNPHITPISLMHHSTHFPLAHSLEEGQAGFFCLYFGGPQLTSPVTGPVQEEGSVKEDVPCLWSYVQCLFPACG